jgi:hypothetical protein
MLQDGNVLNGIGDSNTIIQFVPRHSGVKLAGSTQEFSVYHNFI